MSQHVVELPTKRLGRLELGGKGASLQQLLEFGEAVPPAWVVVADAFRAHLERPAVAALMQSLAREPAPAALQQLREAIEREPLSAEFDAQLRQAIGALGPGPFAVRSSACDEDGAAHSFAGQHDSLLDVAADQVSIAVRRCWASAYTERATRYRASNGHGAPAMAVVLQRMVAAEVAGVLFTCDPVQRRGDRLVLEAVKGLGEALVSGRVTPQRWVLSRTPLSVLERPAEAPLCSDADVLALARRALALEAKVGSALDLEWAAAAGTTWLVQQRPVTTLTPGRTYLWTNTNTGELMPDVATPLSFSLIDRYVGTLFRGLLGPFGIELGNDPIVGRIGGRVYFCLNTFLGLMWAMPGLGKKNPAELFGGNVAEMNAAVAALKPGDVSPIKVRWGRALLGLGRTLRALWQHRRVEVGPVIAHVRSLVQPLLSTPPERCDDRQLDAAMSGLHTLVFESENGLFSVMVGVGCINGVTSLSARWLGDEKGVLTGRLLSGLGGMASAEAGHALWRLSELARAERVRALIDDDSPWHHVAAQLATSEAGRTLLAAFDAFHAQHGHHARGEIDVAVPRWSETPDATLATVRAFMRGPESSGPLRLHERKSHERQALEAEVMARLGWPRRALFTALLTRAQRALVLRENLKSLSIECIAAVRRCVLEAGRRLHQRGLLPSGDAVFLLTFDELSEVLQGGPMVPAHVVAARQRDLEHFRTLTPPALVLGSLEPGATALLPPPPADARTLTGLAVSPGVVEGVARVVLRADEDVRVAPGEILVAPFTDPGWTPYFVAAGGVVVDMGGMLSHGSIVAREYGIPAVVNVGCATTVVKSGQRLRVDGDAGVVTVLDAPPS